MDQLHKRPLPNNNITYTLLLGTSEITKAITDTDGSAENLARDIGGYFDDSTEQEDIKGVVYHHVLLQQASNIQGHREPIEQAVKELAQTIKEGLLNNERASSNEDALMKKVITNYHKHLTHRKKYRK